GLSFAFAGSALAKAAPCKDASGKFVKCAAAATPAPTATPASKTVRCKDATGKFTKCPGPATSPPVTTVARPSKPVVQARTVAATRSTTIPTGSSVGAPAGATAKCKDGTYSMSKTHSGTCSHHGGVANWL